jgi:hypothetical protein
MEAYQGILKEIAKKYHDHLKSSNPNIEFYRYERENVNTFLISDRATDIPFTMPTDTVMPYNYVVNLLERNKHKIDSWSRITFLDSQTNCTFITFVIEDGKINTPGFLFESNLPRI